MVDQNETSLARSRPTLESHSSPPAVASSGKTAAAHKRPQTGTRILPSKTQPPPSHSWLKSAPRTFCLFRTDDEAPRSSPVNRHKCWQRRSFFDLHPLVQPHSSRRSPTSSLQCLSNSTAYRQSLRPGSAAPLTNKIPLRSAAGFRLADQPILLPRPSKTTSH